MISLVLVFLLVKTEIEFNLETKCYKHTSVVYCTAP